MLPDSNWNTPFITIEENRKDSQYKKLTQLSELWGAQFSEDFEKTNNETWKQIFDFQNTTLSKQISEANSTISFFNQLQNSCWQYGRAIAEKDWPTSNIAHPHDAFLALSSLKIGHLNYSECFLLERKTAKACTFYWLSSPIEHTQLCLLYHEIFRGYFYHLSRNLRVEIHSSILPSSEEKVKVWKLNLLWID